MSKVLNFVCTLLLGVSTANVAQENTVPLKHAKVWLAAGLFNHDIEGPAVDSAGVLYAVNFARSGTIGTVNIKGEASLLLDLPKGSTGNGIRILPDGDLLVADYSGHNILRVNVASKAVSVFAHNKNMHQPNDLTLLKSGVIFASDPDWSNNSGQLWRINTDGSTQLMEANMGTTNGIEVSPDQRQLYVNESVQRRIWVYDLSPEHELSNKRLLVEFADFGLDGMRADQQGNLYIARYGKGTVAVVSPQGTLLAEIKLSGEFPTNVAFGGCDGKQLFITMQKSGAIETINVDFAGASVKQSSGC
jgi:sugar lactone lactonase YvrE